MPEFYILFPEKSLKYPNFYICPKKMRIPEFYRIFARKMAEFCIIIARKIFLSRIFGGQVPPVSYPYVWTIG